MTQYLIDHWLDITTTVLGFIYIVLEYRASILLWFVGIVMPALDVTLYYSHGLYGDAGMAVYYTLAAVYGWAVWKFAKKGKQKPLHRQHRAGARRFHERPELCRPVDLGQEICRAMALLDCGGRRELLPVYRQGPAFQGFALWRVCGDSRGWIPQMGEDGSASKTGLTRICTRALHY